MDWFEFSPSHVEGATDCRRIAQAILRLAPINNIRRNRCMARSTRQSEPAPTAPTLTASAAKKVLSALLERGKILLAAPSLSQPAYTTWTNQCREELEHAFGSESDYFYQFLAAGRSNRAIMHDYPESWYEERRKIELEVKVKTLDALITDVLSLKIEQESPEAPTPLKKLVAQTRDVFVVHGHDEAAKTKVARVLERLEFSPIILHEKADEGMTIIEKLEKHGTGAVFAVVIITPDDVGSVKGASTSQPRARQNVLLELGYFIGKLSRNRVCTLYVEGVELPSDFVGVIYTPLDSHNAWEMKLAKELRAAGLPVDLNKL